MIALKTLIAQACTVAALLLVYLANEWMTEGLGINPWLAIPSATALMALPHIFNHYLTEVIPTGESLSCIQIRTPR